MTPYQKNILSFLIQLNVVVWSSIALYAFVWLPYQDQISARLSAIALKPTATPTQKVLPTQTPAPTVTLTPRRLPLPTQVASLPLPIAPAAPVALAAPSGVNPSSAMIPSESWNTLNAGTRVWYRIGTGGVHMDVSLEANLLDGLTMEIFAPGNLDRPIGQGTLDSKTNRLVWAGGHWESSGDWLARVTNGSAAAVQYKLTSVTREIPRCESISYWEYIGKELVYWTKCK